MKIRLWAELDSRGHLVYFITALDATVGFEDILDFCEELHFLHEHNEWMED